MIAHNLAAYLLAQYPSYPIVDNGVTEGLASSADFVLVQQSGGEPHAQLPRCDYTVQIISASRVLPAAEARISAIFEKLRSRFGLALPEAVVGDTTYPAVTAWEIRPLQAPGYLGTDEQGRHLWSVNFIVVV